MDSSNTIKEKSCGTIVYHKKNDGYEFLLLHYPEGHWDFPKGHVEKGETEIETALRELEEETDIKDGKVHENFREEMHYFFQNKENLISKNVVFFLVEASDQDVVISHEHENFLWLPYEEAHEKMTFKNAKEILKKAFKFLAR